MILDLGGWLVGVMRGQVWEEDIQCLVCGRKDERG